MTRIRGALRTTHHDAPAAPILPALVLPAAFTPQRLICRRGRRGATPVAVVDVVFHVFVELFEQESAF